MKKIYSFILTALLLLGAQCVIADGTDIGGDYLYFNNKNIKASTNTTISDWQVTNGTTYLNVWGGSSTGGYQTKYTATNVNGDIYKIPFVSGNFETLTLLRGPQEGYAWNQTYDIAASNFANGKNYFWCSDGNYYYSYYTEDARIYFDNSNASWTKTINFLIGRGDYTSNYEMTAIANTKLYHANVTNWANYDRYKFVNEDSYGAGSFAMDGSKPSTGYTEMTSNDLIRNKINLFTFGGTNGGTLSKTEYSEVSSLNKNQSLVQAYYNGTEYVSPSVSLARIRVSGFEFTNYTTCGAFASAKGFDANSIYSEAKVNAAGYTSTITISVDNVINGFTFDGFYNTTTGAAVTHTTTDGVHSCSYDVTQANTIEARFSPVDYTYTANSSGWGTLCLPYNIAADGHGGVTFYSILGVDNISNPSVMYLVEEEEELSAGCPYIVYAKSSSTITAGSSMATAGSSNGLIGTYVRTEVANGYYVIYDGKVQKVNVSGDGKVVCGANRAYIDIYDPTLGVYDPNNPAPGRRIVEMPMAPNTTTALEDVMVSEKAVKFFENGQMYILRNGVTYDMTGRAVK